MDTILPNRVNITYLDYSREYDPNEQYAQRMNKETVNVTSLDLAIVLTSTEAARCAEVLLYMYWLERNDISFSLPPSYNQLEPGDVVTINAEEGTYSVRITEITYAQDGRLECKGKYNNAATYTSEATGGDGTAPDQSLAPDGNTEMVLLDIPCLIDLYNTSGYIAAATSYSPSWPGGSIYRSDDDGQTWTNLQGFTSPGSEMGYAANAIGAGRTDMFDHANALTVFLISGSLSAESETNVLNGSNWFAYGASGRWEIIGVKSPTLQSDGSYIFTDMLRGRKGTEWAMTTHQIGDAVVLLDSNSIAFITTNTSSIGSSRMYKGVTVDQSLDEVAEDTFTYLGVNLECLSPIGLSGYRNSAGDWIITWIRRTRVDGEWRDLVDAGLGETTEQYIVEFYSASDYVTLKHTSATLTTSTYTYTSASQITDFTAQQSTLYAKIYQLSAVVGRGYPLVDSITRVMFNDLLWPSTVLAMHMDGANDGTVFTDLKGKAITRANAVTKTAIKKGGTASAYFNGTTAMLSTPDHADFYFAANDFTIECWVYFLAQPTTSFAIIGQRLTDTTGISMVLFYDPTSIGLAFSYNGTTNNFCSFAGVQPLNTWIHIAACREGANLRLFIDGVLKTTFNIGANSLFNSTALMKIGAVNTTSAYFMNGYIDDVRITRAARYNADFTPEVPFIDN